MRPKFSSAALAAINEVSVDVEADIAAIAAGRIGLAELLRLRLQQTGADSVQVGRWIDYVAEVARCADLARRGAA